MTKASNAQGSFEQRYKYHLRTPTKQTFLSQTEKEIIIFVALSPIIHSLLALKLLKVSLMIKASNARGGSLEQ